MQLQPLRHNLAHFRCAPSRPRGTACAPGQVSCRRVSTGARCRAAAHWRRQPLRGPARRAARGPLGRPRTGLRSGREPPAGPGCGGCAQRAPAPPAQPLRARCAQPPPLQPGASERLHDPVPSAASPGNRAPHVPPGSLERGAHRLHAVCGVGAPSATRVFSRRPGAGVLGPGRTDPGNSSSSVFDIRKKISCKDESF